MQARFVTPPPKEKKTPSGPFPTFMTNKFLHLSQITALLDLRDVLWTIYAQNDAQCGALHLVQSA